LYLGVLVSSVSGLGCVGCDVGHQDDQPIIGQVDGNFVPVTVTLQSSTIQMGDPVVLQFNRLLNPGSVDRQTIEILQADGTPFADAQDKPAPPRYAGAVAADNIART